MPAIPVATPNKSINGKTISKKKMETTGANSAAKLPF
jgi:hypothetical protein